MNADTMNKAAAREQGAYTVEWYEPTNYARGNNGRGTLTVPKDVGEALAARFPGSFNRAKATEVTVTADGEWSPLVPGEYLTWKPVNGHGARAWSRFKAEQNVSFKTWGNHSYATSPMSETYWCS
jgi:hypothetical protein